MASTDDVVEGKADEYPRHVVKGRCRRHVGHATKGDWKIDVLEETYPELLVQYPLEQWSKKAGQEEKYEAIIELTARK